MQQVRFNGKWARRREGARAAAEATNHPGAPLIWGTNGCSFHPGNGAHHCIRPRQPRDGSSGKKKKKARGTAARGRTSHLRLCLLPLSADEREECAATRPLWSPIAVARVSGVYRAVTWRGTQQVSLFLVASLFAHSPPLPAPHARYFHHFHAFVPLRWACSSYTSKLNFPCVLSTPPPNPHPPAGIFCYENAAVAADYSLCSFFCLQIHLFSGLPRGGGWGGWCCLKF